MRKHSIHVDLYTTYRSLFADISRVLKIIEQNVHSFPLCFLFTLQPRPVSSYCVEHSRRWGYRTRDGQMHLTLYHFYVLAWLKPAILRVKPYRLIKTIIKTLLKTDRLNVCARKGSPMKNAASLLTLVGHDGYVPKPSYYSTKQYVKTSARILF